MGGSMDRHRERVRQVMDAPMTTDGINDIEVGATSDDVSKYMPLASNVLTELVSSQLKKSEDESAKKAAANTPAAKAQAQAVAARQAAALAAAKAVGESDPNGPLHQAATAADTAARVAEATAAAYGPVPGTGAAASSPGAGAHGGGGTDKGKSGGGVPSWVWWTAGGVGVLSVGLIAVKLFRRRR